MCFASRSRQVPDSTRFASWSRQVTDSMAETSVADTCFGPLNAGGAAAPATLRSAAQLGRRGAASTRQRPTRQTAIHSPDSPGEQIARRRFTSPIYSVSKSPDSDSLARFSLSANRQTAIRSPDLPGEQIARRRFARPIYPVSKSPDGDSLALFTR